MLPNRFTTLLSIWIVFSTIGLAGDSIRLAITCDEEFSKEAELLSVELPKIKDVVLLERQRILKIAQEHALSTDKDKIKLGQLLGADGLLILSGTEVNGRKLIAARLVAVNLGVVIDEWTSPPYEAADGRGMGVFFSRRISSLIGKLRVKKDDVVPVSVAGLFSAVDSPELRAVERELTWLLIHRLTKEPSVFVLERRKMEDLAWEKYLAASEPKPFLGGAVIVEGKLEARDGKLDLALGLRRPGEKKVNPSTVTGASNNLPAFAEKIATSILSDLKLKSVEGSWNIEEEAAVYAHQAEWALHHRMIDLCITSAESAWALGRRDVDLARIRVIAYSLIATPYWPDIMGDTLSRGGFNVGYNDWKLRGKDPTRDLATAIRALEISSECLSADLPPSRTAGRKFHPVAAQALLHASQLIKKHYLSGKYQEHAEQLNYLRSLAIDVATALSNTPEVRPPNYNMSYRKDSLTLESIASYAPYWHENNEEVVAWLHRLFKSVPLGEHNDDALMNTYNLEEHRSYDDVPARLVPWVVAWNPAQTRQRQLDMITRLKRLTESADFEDQLVGWASLRWLVDQAAKAERTEHDISWPQDYAAAIAGKPTDASPHHTVSKGALEFLWKYREKLATCHETVAARILYHVPSEADRDYRLRYVRYIFHSGHLNHWASITLMLDDQRLTEAESIEFHNSCIEARKKAQKIEDSNDKEGSLNYLNAVEKMLVKGNPELKPKPKTKPAPKQKLDPQPKPTPMQSPSSPPMIVTRYWYPKKSADAPHLSSGLRFDVRGYCSNSVSYADGKLWYVQSGNNMVASLGSVELDSFHTEYRTLLLSEMLQWGEPPLVTKDAVYLLNMGSDQKWDRHTGRWSLLDLPHYPYSGKILGDSLYLHYEFGSEFRGIDLNRSSSAGSGILRLDLSNDRPTFLASSRRRPAETILDAREPYIPRAFFSNAGGAISAALEFPASGERKIFRTTDSGDWEKVMDLPNTEIGQVRFQYVTDGVIAFMYPRSSLDKFFQINFFDAGGGTAQVLLSHAEPTDPPDAFLPAAPRWDLQAKSIDILNTAFDYYEGRLYQMKTLEHLWHEEFKESYTDVPTPEVILKVYTPDSRLPLSIPLRFQLSEADKAQIIANKYNFSDSKLSARAIDSFVVKQVERVSGMKVVPEGIVFFGGEGLGFWLLPKKELEERIEQNRK